MDSNQNGITQIQTVLASTTELASIHIISHGDVGSITLGSLTLNQSNVSNYQAQLAEIGHHLSATGDILLYGCEIAADTGQAFIEQLSGITGADIAASTDTTGNASLGGDWQLEATVGNIETSVAIASLGQMAFQGVLGWAYNATNGHYYQFVNQALSWEDAKLAAEGMGVSGDSHEC